jgi:flagellar hook-associated protein 3 FlgL
MATTNVSNIGLQLFSISSLQSQQSILTLLNEQLATGKQHNDLTGYTTVEARNLIDFQSGINQRKAYIAAMDAVSTRLKVYDQTMTDIEKITAQAQQLSSQNQNYDPTKLSQIQAQVQAYLQQIADDLNQKVGDRYIYAGTRYDTAPVVDLTGLTAPTFPFTPVTSPTLPDYDTDYVAPGPTSSAAAWAEESVTVNTAFTIQYGVTSTDPAFQQLIAGLRLFNDATQLTDPVAYQAAVISVGTILGQAISDIQGVHAAVANNSNILDQQTKNQNANIANLQSQISNIQKVDLAEVGTKINVLQAQLQASYSATASLTQLSILNFL